MVHENQNFDTTPNTMSLEELSHRLTNRQKELKSVMKELKEGVLKFFIQSRLEGTKEKDTHNPQTKGNDPSEPECGREE